MDPKQTHPEPQLSSHSRQEETEERFQHSGSPAARPHDPDDNLDTRQIKNLSSSILPNSSLLKRAGTAGTLGTRQVAGGTPDETRIDGRLREGSLLQGRYRVLGTLGMGGMSAVYKAQDMRFPNVVRLCAIKEMINTAPDRQVRAMIVRNFEREANILATLSHPAIPQVYDYFTEEDCSYLVMEFIQGQDLEALLASTEGYLPEAQVIDWACQICDVLTYLHNHQPRPIIFRDLKPSNIMLDNHNRIRLIDFGIAKAFQSGQKGTMVGTEGYSPPEQYRGIAEPRGDLYALAATIHHLLSKQDPRLEPPFSFHERPIHNTNPLITKELSEIVNHALEYDINKRFGSAEEMKRALSSLLGGKKKGLGPRTDEPTIVSSETEALWRFACEDEVRSSPIVVAGVLYVGAYDQNLYALDAASGKFLWKYPTGGGIASSPCVAETRVLVGSVDRSLYCINSASGRLAWTFEAGGPIYSSPKVDFGHVFFGADDHVLYAVNLQSGRQAWRFGGEGQIRSSPCIGHDLICFGCDAGSFYALDISGQLTWRFRARRAITSTAFMTDDAVFVGSQDWHIYALDIRSGWPIWRYRTNGVVVSSPVVSQNILYVGSVDTHMYALDTESGRLVWKYQTEGQVTSSPTIVEGAVYFGSVDGAVYSVDAKTGTLRWRFLTGRPVTSSPTVVNGVVYIGSTDRYVYAIPA